MKPQLLAISLLSLSLTACAMQQIEDLSDNVPTLEEDLANVPDDASVATFAGGCFWCIETAMDNQPGVYAAISGYAGGTKQTAGYYQVVSGNTDHRESVQVHYDPSQISYQQLLDIFWTQIDPTDEGGQFADRGPQYTTAIFYHDPDQQMLAESARDTLNSSGKFEEPIATEILPFTTFFPAEEEHQNFAQKKAAYYQRYKEGSGRSGYIEETWEK